MSESGSAAAAAGSCSSGWETGIVAGEAKEGGGGGLPGDLPARRVRIPAPP